MSYTMTLDMPQKASAYVERRGPRFQSQLKSLIIAFVTMEMQNEGLAAGDVPARKTGSAFARAWGRIGLKENELDLSRRPETLREIDFS